MDVVDLMIYESGSGGDLNLKNDDLETVSGLTNQVYLALFGGNIEESTSDDLEDLDERNDWWGNYLLNEELQFNSSFERTLTTVTLNSGGISKLVNAAKKDLKYLEDYADITVEGSITGLNKFQLQVNLQEPDQSSTKIKFIWDGTKGTIETIII